MTAVQPIRVETTAELPGKDEGDFTYGDTPEDIAHDNYRRATFAAEAVKAYAQATGVSNEDVETAIGDLLSDLRHLLDCLGLGSLEEFAESKRYHYDAERLGVL